MQERSALRENPISAKPAKDPVAMPPFTEVETKRANALPSRPFHVTLSEADAPVASSAPARHSTGLLAKEPPAVPVVMWTAGSLALHCESRARTAEGPVPPPEAESGGENETLAENEQLIDPGASPENARALGAAEAGVTAANIPATASSTAAKPPRRRLSIRTPPTPPAETIPPVAVAVLKGSSLRRRSRSPGLTKAQSVSPKHVPLIRFDRDLVPTPTDSPTPRRAATAALPGAASPSSRWRQGGPASVARQVDVPGMRGHLLLILSRRPLVQVARRGQLGPAAGPTLSETSEPDVTRHP